MTDPKNSNFYYLDGLEKKGPYNAEEIKSRNLRFDTLIFKEGSNDWLPLSYFPELYSRESKLSDKTELTSPQKVPDSEQQKIKVHPVFIIFFGLLVSCGVSFLIVHYERSVDLKKINSEIDMIFKGKSIISDYSFTGTTGQLFNVNLTDFLNLGTGEKTYLTTEKHFIISKPILKDNADEFDIREFNNDLKRWNQFKEFVEYYEADRNTGFYVYRLKKLKDSFELEVSWSGDMAYKVREFEHHPGFSSSFYTSPGYDIPTYRPSIKEAYIDAAKYLTIENEDKSYEAGSFKSIDTFEQIESNFYEIEQSYPRYAYYSDTIFVQYKAGDYGRQRGFIINNNRISKNTSRHDSFVYSPQWIVWYKSYSNTFFIKEKNWIYFKNALIYSISLFAFFLVIFLIIKYRKRIQF